MPVLQRVLSGLTQTKKPQRKFIRLNETPVQGREYPVLKCRSCRSYFFALPPNSPWNRCFVNSLIVFVDDLREVNINNKLSFYHKGDGLISNIIPVS